MDTPDRGRRPGPPGGRYERRPDNRSRSGDGPDGIRDAAKLKLAIGRAKIQAAIEADGGTTIYGAHLLPFLAPLIPAILDTGDQPPHVRLGVRPPAHAPLGAESRRWQRHALELKVWREGEKNPLTKGLSQLDEYLERLSLDEGVLVLFDRRKEAGDTESRTRFEQAQTPSGRKVTVLRA